MSGRRDDECCLTRLELGIWCGPCLSGIASYRRTGTRRSSHVKQGWMEGDGIIRSEPAEGGRDLAFDTWLLLISHYYSLGTLVLLYCTCTIIVLFGVRSTSMLLYNVNLLVGPWILGYTHTHTHPHKYTKYTHIRHSHTHTPTPTHTHIPTEPPTRSLLTSTTTTTRTKAHDTTHVLVC